MAYLAKFPDHGHRTVAKALHDEHPQLFQSVEIARSALRQLTGNKGDQSRATAPIPRDAREPGYAPRLPKSRAKAKKPFALKGPKKILMMSDLHVPYHDEKAIELAIQTGIDEGCDTVVLLGDVMDCYQISRWTRDPSYAPLKDELKATKQFLEYLRSKFPEALIVWKEGNHEERWLHFFFQNAPQFVGLPFTDLYSNAGARDFDIEIVDEKRKILAGGLIMYHGHELPKGLTNPVNQARGQFLRALSNMICGHGHRTSQHVENSEGGHLFGNWSLGCLCHLKPDFASINKWNHGFATVNLEKNGQFHVQNYMIHNGELLGTRKVDIDGDS